MGIPIKIRMELERSEDRNVFEHPGGSGDEFWRISKFERRVRH